MTVYPLIDRTSCEIVLAYKRDNIVCAEVYRRHGGGFWTHYNAQDIRPTYLGKLIRPMTSADVENVAKAIRLYAASGCAASEPAISPGPLTEWEEAVKKRG